MLNNCLEWDKWVTHLSQSRQLFNTLIPPVAGGLSLAYTVLHCAGLVTPECTRGVIDPLYHSRHNGRDRQYECDRGINARELRATHYQNNCLPMWCYQQIRNSWIAQVACGERQIWRRFTPAAENLSREQKVLAWRLQTDMFTRWWGIFHYL